MIKRDSDILAGNIHTELMYQDNDINVIVANRAQKFTKLLWYYQSLNM